MTTTSQKPVPTEPVPRPAHAAVRAPVRTGPAGRGRRLSMPKVLLLVLAPLTVLALFGALIAALWPSPVRAEFREAGAARLAVSIPDARIELMPSGDGGVHVEVSGWYSGGEPDFTVRTENGETVVRGGCEATWLSRCGLTVAIALPADADVRVVGTNGDVAGTGLGGTLDIGTANGTLRLSDVTGALSLHTTNGAIRVDGASSPQLFATTTNGQVELDFTAPPTEALARTTNGAVSVRVPEGESYFVDARTTNGGISTAGVESDRRAERTITAETTNGGITVERSDR